MSVMLTLVPNISLSSEWQADIDLVGNILALVS